MNIYEQIERNAINNDYINNTAITQILPSNTIKTISYKDLFELSEKVSQLLLNIGIKQKEKIYISSKDSINFVSAFLGALKVGIVPIPGNPELSEKQILYILHDSSPKVILNDALLNKKKIKFVCSIYTNKNWQKLLSEIKYKNLKLKVLSLKNQPNE